MKLNKEQGIFGLPVLEDNIIWIWVMGKEAVVVDPAVSDPVIEFLRNKNHGFFKLAHSVWSQPMTHR